MQYAKSYIRVRTRKSKLRSLDLKVTGVVARTVAQLETLIYQGVNTSFSTDLGNCAHLHLVLALNRELVFVKTAVRQDVERHLKK